MEAPGFAQNCAPKHFGRELPDRCLGEIRPRPAVLRAVRKQQLESAEGAGGWLGSKPTTKRLSGLASLTALRGARPWMLCAFPINTAWAVSMGEDVYRCEVRICDAPARAQLRSCLVCQPHRHSRSAAARRAPDRWNPQHVDSLPADIRNAVTRMCSQAPKAERDLTSYFENSRRIVLHFQHFRCDGRPLCTRAGCPQQVYIFTGGHHRLLKSYYGPAGE